jgi:hypothetical protein
MNLTAQIAKHFRDVHYGGNWTSVNLQDTLKDVGWQQAITRVGNLNTIAALVFHINYYVAGVSQVMQGGTLDIKDKYSYDLPPIHSEEEWKQLLDKLWRDASSFAELIEAFPEQKLNETFVDEKYGTYYRNFTGIIEHTHYHLGQIVLIKKLILQKEGS